MKLPLSATNRPVNIIKRIFRNSQPKATRKFGVLNVQQPGLALLASASKLFEMMGRQRKSNALANHMIT